MCEPTQAELNYCQERPRRNRQLENSKYYRRHAKQVKHRAARNKMINMLVKKMCESKIIENNIKVEDVEESRKKAHEKHCNKLSVEEIDVYFNDLCKRVKMVWESHEKLNYTVHKRGYNRHHMVGNKVYVLIPKSELS